MNPLMYVLGVIPAVVLIPFSLLLALSILGNLVDTLGYRREFREAARALRRQAAIAPAGALSLSHPAPAGALSPAPADGGALSYARPPRRHHPRDWCDCWDCLAWNEDHNLIETEEKA